ncbi:MAG: Cobalt-zinc-cadmium resistance protein CzcA, partial [Candidatus Parcubacteria bacterium]
MQHSYITSLESTRYGFFVKNYKLSFLIIALLVVYGSFAAYQIPKESSPDIKFGIVSVMTAYPGANPLDIDSIITEKVEKEIKDLEGIDKYESSSAVGFSSTTITLKNDIDVNKF